ncbi:AVAST type 1 anti-phage system protein Avs1c [Gillisia sp. CAL575]|uniref:AVAST type 1 anti-phage system protein Avs1c n=1 Tax=Gillisia sp. CAL575 TaxID=985255 RepID=UPI0003A9062C|nr:AVAST type 1 anti-phage system protein Avs1c [Gillisia sp. CAL575]
MKAKRAHIESRKEFERNLNILIERMREGKIHFSRGIEGIHKTEISLLRARGLPNKRFDFNTVNEMLRLLANTSAQFDNDEYEKKE